MEHRACSKCGGNKPLSGGFYFHKRHGYSYVCKDCTKADRKARYSKDSTRQKAVKRSAYHADLASSRARRRRAYKKVRAEVIAAYGGRCSCCGERREEFLAVDHIHGDGKKDRTAHGAGYSFYIYLRRNGFPKDRYRLLCHNCNMAYGLRGYCPHEQEREAASYICSPPLHLTALSCPSASSRARWCGSTSA